MPSDPIIVPTHDLNIPEAVLQRLVLAHVNKITGVKVWRANTGMASTAAGNKMRFGVKGQADLTGIISGGRRLEIECKRLHGVQSTDQKKWQIMIEAFGGTYILCRNLSEAVVPLCNILGLEFEIR